MITVWKYELALTDEQSIEMPFGAEILTVQRQHESVCLWARVESENVTLPRKIFIVGTGLEVNHNMKYIGTIQSPTGVLVFHVFEEVL